MLTKAKMSFIPVINMNNIMNIPVNYSRLSHDPTEIILMLIWCIRNISYFYQCCSIFVETVF